MLGQKQARRPPASFGDKPRQHLDRSHRPAVTPSRLPAATSTSPSVNNCAASRAGDAPRAPRTAISRFRLSERTSSRLETFTHAISNSKPAPPSSASRIGRHVPDNRLIERNHARALAAVRVRILPLQLFRNRRHIGLRGLHRDSVFQPRHSIQAVAAAPRVRTDRRDAAPPRSPRFPSAQTENSPEARQSSVIGTPLSETVSPITSFRPPNRRCHAA